LAPRPSTPTTSADAAATPTSAATASGETCDGARTRILDVAEAAFAENGIDATSLRALTRIAGVNVAAVHYHFGSKDGLLDAVFARRASDVTSARLAALDELDAPNETGSANAPVQQVGMILTAYVAPAVERAAELGRRGLDIARLLARLQTERSDRLEALSREHLADVHSRFIDALSTALPHLSRAEVADRFRLALGCMNQAFTSDDRTQLPERSDAEWIAALVEFATAGIAAGAGEAAATIDTAAGECAA